MSDFLPHADPAPQSGLETHTGFEMHATPADPHGRRSFTAVGAGGEHTDRFHPDDAFRREKFLRQAIAIAGEPEADETLQAMQDCLTRTVHNVDRDPAWGEEPERVVFRMASTIQSKPIDWLWPGRLPLGSLAMLAGDPGLSKSTLALDIAARVSTGAAWPDGRGGRSSADGHEEHAADPTHTASPAGVVVLSAEDDAETTIVPRLKAHGADCSRIALVEGVGKRRHPLTRGGNARTHDRDPKQPAADLRRSLSLATDLDLVRKLIDQQGDTRLVIVDPISAYTPGIDTHRNADVRGLLAPLARLAAEKRLTVLCVTHLNKSQSGPAVYRTMGSLAYIAAARVGHLVARDPDEGQRRLLLPIKNNLAPDRDGLAYTIETAELDSGECVGRLVWDPTPVCMSADELQGEASRSGEESSRRRDHRVAEAEAWLRDELADGERGANELLDSASEQHGLGSNTVRKAAKRLGVEMRQSPGRGPYVWRLPPDAAEGEGSPGFTSPGEG